MAAAAASSPTHGCNGSSTLLSSAPASPRKNPRPFALPPSSGASMPSAADGQPLELAGSCISAGVAARRGMVRALRPHFARPPLPPAPTVRAAASAHGRCATRRRRPRAGAHVRASRLAGGRAGAGRRTRARPGPLRPSLHRTPRAARRGSPPVWRATPSPFSLDSSAAPLSTSPAFEAARSLPQEGGPRSARCITLDVTPTISNPNHE